MTMFDYFLDRLGELLGVKLQHYEDGYLAFAFDNNLTFLLKHETRPDGLVLFCKVGEAPLDDAEFCEELLASNLFWCGTGGATLSLERYSRHVILARYFPEQLLAEIELCMEEMRKFFDYAEKWQDIIVTLVEQENEPVTSDMTGSQLLTTKM